MKSPRRYNEAKQVSTELPNKTRMTSTPPPVALFSSAEKCMQDRQFQQAIDLFGQIGPTSELYPASRARMGLCLIINSQLEDGWILLDQAKQLNPNDAKVWNCHGQAHETLQNSTDAISCFQKAVQLDPGHIASHNALATIFYNMGENRHAIGHLKAILRTQPDNALTQYKIGKIHLFDGQLKKAIKFFQKAHALNPTMGENWMLLSHALFLQGDMTAGFEVYRNRFLFMLNFETERARELSPEWQGEDLNGKSLLILWEQGLGDSIQNLRYINALQNRGAEIHLCIQPILTAFARQIDGVQKIYTKPEDLPATDFHIPFFEIPARLNDQKEDIYRTERVPYLSTQELETPQWLNTLPSARKIGLVWQGSPSHSRDASRSVPLSAFQALTHLGETTLCSLQTLNGLDQISGQDWLINLEPQIMGSENSLVALAQAVDAMDHIICCDTMVCHLAGALGKDVRLLTSTIPDWRWPLEGSKTPWYPQTTLYQQGRGENWDSVIQRVMADLRNL